MLWFDYYWHKVMRRPYSLARRIDKGRGQPVVFLHGIASSGESWRQVAESLDPTKYRIIVFDLLGFGESPQPDWMQYSVDDHAESVLASLRRMHIRRPVILVGHSMGSLVAAHIAHKYPRKVRQLILYQMPVYSAIPSLNIRDFKRQAYLSVFRYLAEHPKVTLWYAKVLGRVASKVTGFVLDENSWQPFELSLRNTIMQQNSYENLRSLSMPTDVIYGKYDVLVLRKNMQHFFRPSKYLRFYEIDELHRVSARAGALIVELIGQDPKQRKELSTKHARIIDMLEVDIKKLSKKEPIEKSYNRKPYVLFGLGSLLVFIIATTAALEGTVAGWEYDVFTYINGWQAPGFVTVLAKLVSDFVWLAVGIVALLFLFKKYFWMAWRLAIPGTAAYGIVFVTEHIVMRARPEVLLASETILRASQGGMGFPSGHVATMTALVFTLWPYMSRYLQWASAALLILVAWSRVYLGVHFPLDVIGGFAVGLGVVCLLHILPVSVRKKLHLA